MKTNSTQGGMDD